jgi:hypothetical protein
MAATPTMKGTHIVVIDGPGAGLRTDAALAAGAPHRIHRTHGNNEERQRCQ